MLVTFKPFKDSCLQAAHCFDGHSAYLRLYAYYNTISLSCQDLARNRAPEKTHKESCVYGRLIIEYSKNAEAMCAWMSIEAISMDCVSIPIHAHFIFLKGGILWKSRQTNCAR